MSEVLAVLTCIGAFMLALAQLKLFDILRELRTLNATLETHTRLLAHIANTSTDPPGIIGAGTATEPGPFGDTSQQGLNPVADVP